MSAPSVLTAAEIKLLKARHVYAKKLLGLLAGHLHRHHPEAVRLSVYADQRNGEYFVGELLGPDGETIDFDPESVVIPHIETDGPFSAPISLGPYGVAALLHRALSMHEGPLTKLLRTERHTGEHYLDLTRIP
jgi:hypothetical protein